MLTVAALEFWRLGSSSTDAAYLSLRLITLEGPTEDATPLIGVLRFLAPLASVAALAALALARWSELVRAIPVRFIRNHTVVVGSDEVVATLVATIPGPVAVIADSPGDELQWALRRRGCYPMTGTGADPRSWRRAGVDRAGALFSLADDPDENLRVVDQFLSRRATEPENSARVVLRLGSSSLSRVARWAYSDHVERSAWIDVLDLDENAAWATADAIEPQIPAERTFMITIVGDSAYARTLARCLVRRQVAQTAGNPGFGQPLAICLEPETARAIENLDDHLAAHPTRLVVNERQGGSLTELPEPLADLLILAHADESQALGAAVELLDLHSDRLEDRAVVVVVDQEAAARSLLRGSEVIVVSSRRLGATATVAMRTWQDRVAERLHRDYLAESQQTPSQMLDEATLRQNRRSIATLHASLQARGVRIAPVDLADRYPAVHDDQFTQLERELGEAEHNDWCVSKRAAGYEGGPETDDAASPPTNRFLRPWGDLTDQERQSSIRLVRSLRQHLRAVGYELFYVGRPRRRLSQAEAAQLVANSEPTRYASRVMVRARQLSEPMTWQRSNGDTLTAAAGDWLLSRDHEEWSVTDRAFHATYRRVADVWEKVDHVHATRVDDAVTVETPEGEASAEPGDWLVLNALGDVWPIDHRRFDESYRPAPDSPDQRCE